MNSIALPTECAPAERADGEEVLRQSGLVLRQPFLSPILNTLPDLVLILNRQRQIVFANRSALEFMGLQELAEACAVRPGEAIKCIHANECAGGCGTTEFCRECGVLRAILLAQAGKAAREDCRLLRRETAEALDLRVWTAPLEIKGGSFIIFVAGDISHEKRRKALERIFFHDLLNTVGGLQGYAHVLREAEPQEREELLDTITQLADQAVEEIKAQRELVAAETNDLGVHTAPVRCRELIGEVVGAFHTHEAARGKTIKIAPQCANPTMTSDPALLRRVLGNMVKNALEASHPGQIVTIGCTCREPGVEFQVHNETAMPRNVQLQIFQRSFSTKGNGRGLGTYSMKLLSEHYLHGQVAFVSTPAQGTTFTARYPLFLDPA